MRQTGFSIRCPHCLEWHDWPVHPAKCAVDSVEEILAILKKLHEAPETFTDLKLLRCGQKFPRCPAPIEAFVCPTEEDALRFVRAVKAWSLKRDFRLYRTDHITRWKNYTGILFSTLPVPRQRHIQIEDLIDRELLSKAMVRFEEELKGPLTIYAARVVRLNEGEKVIWAPIEAKSGRVPPPYNPFCAICRDLVLQQLEKEFASMGPTPEHCPHTPPLGRASTCAGREPACASKDWNRCPAFLALREKGCPCYICDLALIEEIRRHLHSQGMTDAPVTTTCWAGFTKIGIPIIVHKHLIGVAMTGQLVTKPSRLVPPSHLVEKYPWLAPTLDTLQRYHEILRGRVKPNADRPDELYAAEFGPVTQEEVKRRASVLEHCVRQVCRVAKPSYYQIRDRSESIFAQEILGRIANSRPDAAFFDGPVVEIIRRMREFWAFKAVHLLAAPQGSHDLKVVAFSADSEDMHFGLQGPIIWRLPLRIALGRALPMYFDRENPSRVHSTPADTFIPLLEKALADPKWKLPKGRCYYIVLVPLAEQVFGFVFSVRDEEAVSPFGLVRPRGVSDLAQEIILQTCTNAVHSLGGIWIRQERERAWRDFSSHASHRISNELNTVSNLLYALAAEPSTGSPRLDKLRRYIEIMQERIGAAKEMLVQQAKLTAQLKPERQLVNIEALISSSLVGVLPEAATLDLHIAHEATYAQLDPNLMGQAFRELAFNAVHAGGNRVTISVKGTIERHAVTGKRIRFLRITFENSGPPIEPSQVERIFQPHVSTRAGGMGIGLVTVRRIAEAHGGSIWADPIPTGVRFTMVIPTNGESE